MRQRTQRRSRRSERRSHRCRRMKKPPIRWTNKPPIRWESPNRTTDERWDSRRLPRQGNGAPLIGSGRCGSEAEVLRKPPIKRGGTDMSWKNAAPHEKGRGIDTVRVWARNHRRNASNRRDAKPSSCWKRPWAARRRIPPTSRGGRGLIREKRA
jgi:hypothetical protein